MKPIRLHRKAWTADEVAMLQKLASQKVPLADIAASLNRTTRSVYSKAADQRIALTFSRQKVGE